MAQFFARILYVCNGKNGFLLFCFIFRVEQTSMYVCNGKNGFLLFCFIFKGEQTKIFALNNFQHFVNDA